MSYKIYENVIKMITMPEYRGLELDSSKIKIEEFYNTIHIDNYIIIKCGKKEEEEKKVQDSTIAFYITAINSGITRTIIEFKKLMNKVPNNIKYIYIINEKEFSQQVYNVISLLYSQYIVMKLNNNTFETERPKHMLVSKHEILTQDEYNNLIKYSTIVNPLNLPKIRLDDTQCIWIGAESGDIIKITRRTIIGESTNYRVVIGPISNKIKSVYNPISIDKKDKKNESIVITKKNIIDKKAKRSVNKKNSEIIKKIKLKSK